MRVVRERHIREDPDELLDRRALSDEDVAVKPCVVADREVALEVGTASDPNGRTDPRSFANRHVVAALELRPDLDARVHDCVAPDDGPRPYETGACLVGVRVGIEHRSGRAEDRMGVDVAAVTQLDARVDHAERTHGDIGSKRRLRADDTRGMDCCGAVRHESEPEGEVRRGLCDYSPVSGRREQHEDARSTGSSIHPTAVVETEALGGRCTVAEHASIGPSVVLGDDVRVDAGARIGANAAVRDGVSIGRGATIEPGSVVDEDVPPHAVVRGSPARIVDYVDALPSPTAPEMSITSLEGPTQTRVAGVLLYPLRQARDLRGSLSAVEFDDLPFPPRRVFVVHGVPDQRVRGAHAHRSCTQLLICIAGAVSCVADDGTSRQEFRLSSPAAGLLLPPLVWGMQYRYTFDAVLLVLAELPYDPDDYVRDYDEFLGLVTPPQGDL